ncbi:hypothetical protein B0H13DRAFT_728812 [Mycena leptocephala]|nr:hypothetical protein B0H13DRAFT_728812 [Mycena leptocephala]
MGLGHSKGNKDDESRSSDHTPANPGGGSKPQTTTAQAIDPTPPINTSPTPDPPTPDPPSPDPPNTLTQNDPSKDTASPAAPGTPPTATPNTPTIAAESPGQSSPANSNGNSDIGQSDSQVRSDNPGSTSSRSKDSEAGGDNTAAPASTPFSLGPQFPTGALGVSGASGAVYPVVTPSGSAFTTGSSSSSPSSPFSVGASSKSAPKTAAIIAGVLVPLFFLLFLGAAYFGYKRRRRLNDRREWERTHAEIADAVRNVSGPATPPSAWARLDTASRGDLTDFASVNEKHGDTEPFFEGK